MSKEEILLTIAVPSAGLMKAGGRFSNSLSGLVSKVCSEGIKSRPNAILTLKMDYQESSVIHTNREMIVKRALDENQTHLMFLDDDMVFQPSIIDVLFSRYQPIVCTNYLIKKGGTQI